MTRNHFLHTSCRAVLVVLLLGASVEKAFATDCDFTAAATSYCTYRSEAGVRLDYVAYRDEYDHSVEPGIWYDEDYYIDVYRDGSFVRRIYYYDTSGTIDLGRLPVGEYYVHAVNWGMSCDALSFSVMRCRRCGDGDVDAGEQCDDGNTRSGDGCNARCQSEVAVCGNGAREGGEECDDGNTINTDACLTSCRIARCGDGQLYSGVEQCDDGNSRPGDGCDVRCQSEVPPAVCGDRAVMTPETCDDGNTVSGDGCDNLCRAEVCGNGIVQAGEECDDGSNADDPANADDCVYGCKTARCGDGYVRTGNEQCDDGNTVSGDGCAASCSFEVVVDPPVRPSCGSASGTASCTAPVIASRLCSSGTPSAVSYDAGAKAWTWTCGSGLGTSCAAPHRCSYTEITP